MQGPKVVCWLLETGKNEGMTERKSMNGTEDFRTLKGVELAVTVMQHQVIIGTKTQVAQLCSSRSQITKHFRWTITVRCHLSVAPWHQSHSLPQHQSHSLGPIPPTPCFNHTHSHFQALHVLRNAVSVFLKNKALRR